MKYALGDLLLTKSLLFAVLAIAADKVVISPIGKGSYVGKHDITPG